MLFSAPDCPAHRPLAHAFGVTGRRAQTRPRRLIERKMATPTASLRPSPYREFAPVPGVAPGAGPASAGLALPDSGAAASAASGVSILPATSGIGRVPRKRDRVHSRGIMPNPENDSNGILARNSVG
jgi:hypothetical protein